jgi:hypothetical protein
MTTKQMRCYACRRPIHTGDTYWLPGATWLSSATKRDMALCTECADILAGRDNASTLHRFVKADAS